jgi:hypothetical protein
MKSNDGLRPQRTTAPYVLEFRTAAVFRKRKGRRQGQASAPLLPLPPSPKRRESVSALCGRPRAMQDWIEPYPRSVRLTDQGEPDGSLRSPRSPRAVPELRQNAMEPSPAARRRGYLFWRPALQKKPR